MHGIGLRLANQSGAASGPLAKHQDLVLSPPFVSLGACGMKQPGILQGCRSSSKPSGWVT